MKRNVRSIFFREGLPLHTNHNMQIIANYVITVAIISKAGEYFRRY